MTIAKAWLAVAGSVAIAGAASAVVLTTGHHSHTHVLGEKIQGYGTSSNGGGLSSSATTASPTGSAPGNGGSNGNGGNGNGGGNKTFAISGHADGLFPGGTVQLQLSLANTLNQDMVVKSLSGSLGTISTAAGVSGTCPSTVLVNGHTVPILTVGSWNGSFTLPKSTPNIPAPSTLPVTLNAAAPDACQGATFNLTYSGTADQK